MLLQSLKGLRISLLSSKADLRLCLCYAKSGFFHAAAKMIKYILKGVPFHTSEPAQSAEISALKAKALELYPTIQLGHYH